MRVIVLSERTVAVEKMVEMALETQAAAIVERAGRREVGDVEESAAPGPARRLLLRPKEKERKRSWSQKRRRKKEEGPRQRPPPIHPPVPQPADVRNARARPPSPRWWPEGRLHLCPNPS